MCGLQLSDHGLLVTVCRHHVVGCRKPHPPRWELSQLIAVEVVMTRFPGAMAGSSPGGRACCGMMVAVLLRLIYLSVTGVFGLLRLLPVSNRDKDVEIV